MEGLSLNRPELVDLKGRSETHEDNSILGVNVRHRCRQRDGHRVKLRKGSPRDPVTSRYIVYYEEIKEEIKRRTIYECRCDPRLKSKVEGSTRLGYTGFHGGLEHRKIETRSIDEMR